MTGPALRTQAPFSPMAGVLLALVAAFALSAFFVLAAYAPDLQQGQDGGSHALSRSGVGFAALPQLLRLQGRPVLVSRRRVGGQTSQAGEPQAGLSNAGILVLTPDSAQDGAALQDFHFEGPILIILPKWQTVPHDTHDGWVRRAGLLPAEMLSRALLAPYEPHTEISRATGAKRPQLFYNGHAFATPGEVTQLQTIAGPGWTPVITDAQGRTVLARSGKTGNVYVLADPDLMNNWGMRDLATAQTAEAILTTLQASDGAVVFDVSLNGFGGQANNLLRLLFDPPFLAVTLCLFAAAVLMGIHAIARFGPARAEGRVFAFGKSVLTDNTAALIRLAGREAMVAPRYVALEKSLVARALAAPKDLSPDAVTDFLDRMSRQRQAADTLSSLNEAAGAVRGRGDLLTLAQRLHRWRLEMTREHQ